MALQRSLLLAEAAVTLHLMHVAVLTLPFRILRRALAGVPRAAAAPLSPPVQLDPASTESARQITRAVVAVARRSPWRTTCLTDALAAHAMLRRRGYESRLRVGVRLSESPAAKPAAKLVSHAWLECNGLVVLGGIENLEDYSILS